MSQETSNDACGAAASSMASAAVSRNTSELQATNDGPQHAIPMISHDTLLNDEEVHTHTYIYMCMYMYDQTVYTKGVVRTSE